MRVRPIALVLTILASTVHGQRATAPRERIVRAIELAGGAQALRDISVARRTGTETVYGTGQEYWPWAPSSPTTVLITEVANHTTNAQSRMRSPLNLPPGAVVPAVVVSGTRVGLFARDSVRKGTGVGLATVAREIRRDALLSPERVLLEASALDATSLRNLGTEERNGERLAGVAATVTAGAVELWFASADGALAEVRRREPDPIYGERVSAYRLSQWKGVGAAFLPHQLDIAANGRSVRQVVYSRIEVNPTMPARYFDVPEDNSPVDLGAESAPMVEVQPGVWRLEGGLGINGYGGGIPYYSVVVQQGESLVLIEAPVNGARSRAIMDTLHARFPKARLTSVVVTHGHLDHVGGVAAVLDRGASAIAAVELTNFVQGLRAEGKQGPLPQRRVTGVRDSLTVGSGPNRFTLYRVPNHHAGGLLVAYFPETNLLVEADLQGAAGPEDKRELHAFVTAHGLRIGRIVGLHGDIVDWAAFEGALKK